MSMPTAMPSDGFAFHPDLRIRPILRCFSSVNDRIEGVDLSAVNVLRLLVTSVADGIRIISGSGDQEIQRLHSGVAGAFGHNIKEFSVRLSVQLVKYYAVDIEAVFGICFCGKYLIKAVRRFVDPLLRGQYLYPPV